MTAVPINQGSRHLRMGYAFDVTNISRIMTNKISNFRTIQCISNIGPQDLIQDLNAFGLMFESMCIRDIRVYSESLGGQVYHYRDKNGLECDAVILLRNGLYGLVEIKLGDAKTLNKLSDSIDTDKKKESSFLMVLTAVGKYA